MHLCLCVLRIAVVITLATTSTSLPGALSLKTVAGSFCPGTDRPGDIKKEKWREEAGDGRRERERERRRMKGSKRGLRGETWYSAWFDGNSSAHLFSSIFWPIFSFVLHHTVSAFFFQDFGRRSRQKRDKKKQKKKHAHTQSAPPFFHSPHLSRLAL